MTETFDLLAAFADLDNLTKLPPNKILYSNGNYDECYTPPYAVYPLVKYVPKDTIIWCPFDTLESAFVKILSKTNIVFRSHISDGQDFYTFTPPIHWDMIISNPPFTNKRQIFERALSFGKPFALLMSNTWLNDAAPKQIFKHKDLQLLMFEERIDFTGTEKIPFSSSYFCWNFLPKQIIMESLKGYL
jgi:hypothetical protein